MIFFHLVFTSVGCSVRLAVLARPTLVAAAKNHGKTGKRRNNQGGGNDLRRRRRTRRKKNY